MRIIIFAKRFESGSWNSWEHECDPDEVEAMLDSAAAKAFSRTFSRVPTDIDYREAGRYEFDRAYGTAANPAEGDVRVLRVDVIMSASRSEEGNDFFTGKKSA
ncbi:MAG TPA: hypothetical protein VN682_15550 [Terriglobales bacterium]|nr:hypothetical protein [Terriglobales bacterium]